MSRVKAKGSKPEMAVRRLVYGMGFRYRLHRRELPGSPDLVFASRRRVIFVHGCFWHRHDCKAGRRLPKTRLDFWRPKLEGNLRRDLDNQARLRREGWKVLVVWECEVGDTTALAGRIRRFLEDEG